MWKGCWHAPFHLKSTVWILFNPSSRVNRSSDGKAYQMVRVVAFCSCPIFAPSLRCLTITGRSTRLTFCDSGLFVFVSVNIVIPSSSHRPLFQLFHHLCPYLFYHLLSTFTIYIHLFSSWNDKHSVVPSRHLDDDESLCKRHSRPLRDFVWNGRRKWGPDAGVVLIIDSATRSGVIVVVVFPGIVDKDHRGLASRSVGRRAARISAKSQEWEETPEQDSQGIWGSIPGKRWKESHEGRSRSHGNWLCKL